MILAGGGQRMSIGIGLRGSVRGGFAVGPNVDRRFAAASHRAAADVRPGRGVGSRRVDGC